MIKAMQKVSREKVIRVAFATFKNLVVESPNTIELMVESGIIRIVDIFIKSNIKDKEII